MVLLNVIRLGYCDNCTEIIIDGISRENNDIVYKNVSDDVKISANTGICHEVEPIVPRFNGSNDTPDNCSPSGLSYNCNNLTTKNTGVYRIHVLLDDTLGNSVWCTNSVTIIIQCKENI